MLEKNLELLELHHSLEQKYQASKNLYFLNQEVGKIVVIQKLQWKLLFLREYSIQEDIDSLRMFYPDL